MRRGAQNTEQRRRRGNEACLMKALTDGDETGLSRDLRPEACFIHRHRSNGRRPEWPVGVLPRLVICIKTARTRPECLLPI